MGTRVVTSCKNCPYYGVSSEEISAYCSLADRGGPFSGIPLCTSGSDQGFDYTPPEWCPLREGPHTPDVVELKVR
jgi:hypothetical protein